jgi:hypothetical protein
VTTGPNTDGEPAAAPVYELVPYVPAPPDAATLERLAPAPEDDYGTLLRKAQARSLLLPRPSPSLAAPVSATGPTVERPPIWRWVERA